MALHFTGHWVCVAANIRDRVNPSFKSTDRERERKRREGEEGYKKERKILGGMPGHLIIHTT